MRAGQGQMVALISEAGLGKSRLVAELKPRVGADAEGGAGIIARSGFGDKAIVSHTAGDCFGPIASQ